MILDQLTGTGGYSVIINVVAFNLLRYITSFLTSLLCFTIQWFLYSVYCVCCVLCCIFMRNKLRINTTQSTDVFC